MKKFKLSTKMYAGFGVVLVLLIVVGTVGYHGMQSAMSNIDQIIHQLEIAQKANTILTDAQDTQAASLRYIMYKEDQYNQQIQDEYESVVKNAGEAKDMMESEANKQKADEVIAQMDRYKQANDSMYDLQQKAFSSGEKRAAAAQTVIESIRELMAARKKFIDERTKDSTDGKIVPYEAIDKTLVAQEARNAFNRAQMSAYLYLMAQKPEQQESAAQQWIKELDQTKKVLATCKEQMNDPTCQKLVDQSLEALDSYLAEVQTFRQINQEKYSIQLNRQKPAADAVMAESRAVRDGVYSYIEDVRKNTEKAMNLANSMIAVFGISALIIGTAISILITRGIVKPVSRIIENLTSGAEQVASASSQVSAASQSLAEGSTEQAASLEETSSSLEEMSTMTRQNADNANQANTLAGEAKKLGDTGSEAMGRMSRSITDIQKSSDDTAKIVKTIDEIAFQTNLLALNAAVEAARAGEAGKGFAVVAEEVRNLAMRSAEAAKNTAALIDESVKNSQNGVDIAAEVAKVFENIVNGIGKTTELVSEIAAASNEQAQGIEQVNTAMRQMDTVTQQNAANAEESASASEELSAQAEQMKLAVQELVTLVGGTSDNNDNGYSGRHMGHTDHAYHRIAAQPSRSKQNKIPVAAEKAIPMNSDDFDEFNG